MQIADRLKGRLIVPFFLAAGVTLGFFILRTGGLISLVMLAGLFFIILLYFYPIIGILALIAATCFIPFYTGLPLTNISGIGIPDVILFLLSFIVILRIMVLKDIELVRSPLDAPLIGFILVGMAALVVGKLLHLFKGLEAIHEFKVILYYLLPIIIINLIREKKELKFLIYACLGIAIIAALEVIFIAWTNPPTATDSYREIFYRYHEVSKGGILMYWALISFVCLASVARIHLLYIIGMVVSFFYLILTFSRHWWIAFVFSTLLVVMFNVKRNIGRMLRILLLVIFFNFGVFGLFLLRVEPVNSYLNLIALRGKSLISLEKVENWKKRTVENKYAVKKILAHPLSGIGFKRPYRPQIYGPHDTNLWYVHNGYLWILLKMGILGLIPFVWFSYLFVKRGIRNWNKVEESFLKGIVLGSVCSYLGIALANLASPHFMENWEVAAIGLFFGINEVIYRIEGTESKSGGATLLDGNWKNN
jgi:O-antigen ligase